MSTPKITPGPAAAEAFRLGLVAAMIVPLAGATFFLWQGSVSVDLIVISAALIPVYVLVVAVVLSMWLGYDKGPADTRRIVKEDG
jgi:hypothetical protein